MNPLPPSKVHTRTRLTHAQAHDQLSHFLQRAEIDPAYRPDSILTDQGPVSGSAGGTPNLTLHHLQRILLGMEGKKVGGSEEFLGGETRGVGKRSYREENGEQRPGKRQRVREKMVEQVDGTGEIVVETTGENEGDWQDKEDFELEQGEDEVDVHTVDRDVGAGLRQPANAEEAREEMEVEIEGTGEKVQPEDVAGQGEVLNKEERKRRKKERAQQEKKERGAQRAADKILPDPKVRDPSTEKQESKQGSEQKESEEKTKKRKKKSKA